MNFPKMISQTIILNKLLCAHVTSNLEWFIWMIVISVVLQFINLVKAFMTKVTFELSPVLVSALMGHFEDRLYEIQVTKVTLHIGLLVSMFRFGVFPQFSGSQKSFATKVTWTVIDFFMGQLDVTLGVGRFVTSLVTVWTNTKLRLFNV